ncbi:MAG TPA: UDP-N-acetylglucosamine--N-acetylmuramyl-(pentapeptide) pyrophosphoryl-undecaprenol N-acetylglucosamine transferase [Gaiellaceae bacterium]
MLPALAVAEALRERGAGVTFAGSPGRFEAKLVPEAGFEFDAFEVSGLPRRPGLAQMRAAFRAAGAVRACRAILRRRRPDVVLGGGGYVAGPMVLAAAGQRIPTALMEADAHLGLANRLAAPFARRVFLSFPIEGRSGGRYRVTGRPIPAVSRVKVSQEEARRQFFFEDGPVLLVFGGSQGARSLNELAVESFSSEGPQVLHLSGERDFESLAGRVSRSDYRLLPFVPDFGAALAAADLVLARAGGSVWELAAAGLPAVLVPYPFATANHQTTNARYFEQAGGAVLVPEPELERVPELIRTLLADPDRLQLMSEAMLRLARPRAADEIAEELIALAAARG